MLIAMRASSPAICSDSVWVPTVQPKKSRVLFSCCYSVCWLCSWSLAMRDRRGGGIP